MTNILYVCVYFSFLWTTVQWKLAKMKRLTENSGLWVFDKSYYKVVMHK